MSKILGVYKYTTDETDLPLPRLQLRYVVKQFINNGKTVEKPYWEYGLVWRKNEFIILYSKHNTEKIILYNGKIQIPFVSGMMIQKDMLELKLPCYLIFGKEITPIEFNILDFPNDA